MRRVIIVTDGDCKAKEAVEIAARTLGTRCISLSGCRHSDDARWTPEEVEELVLSTPHDPVLVLVDDEGAAGEGWGEQIMRHLVEAERIHTMGVVAVASDLKDGSPTSVDVSVTADGRVISSAVNKEGEQSGKGPYPFRGDTVENLSDLDIPIVVGLGDPGKMNFADDAKNGAPVTTQAIRLILERAGS